MITIQGLVICALVVAAAIAVFGTLGIIVVRETCPCCRRRRLDGAARSTDLATR